MDCCWWFTALIILALTIYFGNIFLTDINRDNEKKRKEEEEYETKEKENEKIASQYENLKRLPVGRLTLNEISAYNGANGSRILISICGRIFDMSLAYDFYGPNGPYNCFTGGDATFMLGKMSLDSSHKNKKDFVNTSEWNSDAQITLNDWISKFCHKYPIVGRLTEFENVAIDTWKECGLEEKTNNENKKITVEELKNENENLTSVAGYVFDVSPASMVYNSTGEICNAIGNDITFALIKGEYKPENYNQPLNTIMENTEYKQRLKPIFKAFLETYTIVGRLDSPFEVTWEDDEWDIIHSSDAGDA